jgi:hypothetical protein
MALMTISDGVTVDGALVAALDPLGADALCRILHRINETADVRALARHLREVCPRQELVDAWSLETALAAMRDLGMLLGSIKRHGLQPVDAVPQVEPVLVALGARAGMMPRDTVHHYTEWNPIGRRERRYTNDPQESALIDAVRQSFPRLRTGVDLCARLHRTDVHDPEFAVLAGELIEQLRGFEDAITTVTARVSPRFFARELRPYFEEIDVAGHTYMGPAAAHVPLFLVDLTVWACDHATADHRGFLTETRAHTLPSWRTLAEDWSEGPSLVTRLADELARLGPAPVPEALARSAGAVSEVLRRLVLFRSKHLVIARKAYREDVRLYPLGSAGGSIDLLHEILHLTRDNARALSRFERGPLR